MTRHAQLHRRSSAKLAWLAALDLASDDIVRPELRNSAIPAGRSRLPLGLNGHEQAGPAASCPRMSSLW